MYLYSRSQIILVVIFYKKLSSSPSKTNPHKKSSVHSIVTLLNSWKIGVSCNYRKSIYEDNTRFLGNWVTIIYSLPVTALTCMVPLTTGFHIAHIWHNSESETVKSALLWSAWRSSVIFRKTEF